MKKTLLQVFQNLAIGVFVGVSAYGILVLFFEGAPLPARKSILLGLIAFASMVLIVVLGGMVDREAAKKTGTPGKRDGSDGTSDPG